MCLKLQVSPTAMLYKTMQRCQTAPLTRNRIEAASGGNQARGFAAHRGGGGEEGPTPHGEELRALRCLGGDGFWICN